MTNKARAVKLLRNIGYLKPQDLLQRIARKHSDSPFLHDGNASLISDHASLLSTALTDRGIRQIKYLAEGAEGIVFEISENQLVKAWYTSDINDVKDLPDFYRDSRILQPILLEKLGEMNVEGWGNCHFGITVKPKVATFRIMDATKRARRKAEKAGEHLDDNHEFLPRWINNELDQLFIAGLGEDLEPRNYGHMKDKERTPVQFDALGDAEAPPDGNLSKQKALYPNILTGKIDGAISADDMSALEKKLGRDEGRPFVEAVKEEGLYLHGGFSTIDGYGPFYKGLDTILGIATERALKERNTGVSKLSFSSHVSDIVRERQVAKSSKSL